MLTILQYLGVILSFTATFLFSTKNLVKQRKIRLYAWIFYLIADLILMISSIITQQWPFVLLYVGYTLVAFNGIWSNYKEHK